MVCDACCCAFSAACSTGYQAVVHGWIHQRPVLPHRVPQCAHLYAGDTSCIIIHPASYFICGRIGQVVGKRHCGQLAFFMALKLAPDKAQQNQSAQARRTLSHPQCATTACLGDCFAGGWRGKTQPASTSWCTASHTLHWCQAAHQRDLTN